MVDKKILETESKTKDKSLKDRPCRICEKEKKGTRYHSESVCWFKNRGDSNRTKKEPIRSVNNSEIEITLNEIDPKNY